MKKLNLITILLLTALLSSCEKEIEFTGKETTPLIVVNSIICSDSIIKAQISKSKFFLANDDAFDNITDADVSVFINGEFKEKMTNMQNGLYQTTFIPNIGDTVSYKISASGLKDVSSQAIVIPRPDIISMDTTIENFTVYPQIDYTTDNYGNLITTDTTAYSINLQLGVKIKIQDDGSVKNYYKLSPSVLTPINSNYLNVYSTLNGVLSNNQNDANNFLDVSGSYNTNGIFSDELFDGKEFTLSATIQVYVNVTVNQQDTTFLYVNLQNINQDYYNYLFTRDLTSNSDGFFSEPVQIYSNIIGGIGILGGYSNSNSKILKINLEELAKKFPNGITGTTTYNMKHTSK